MNQQIKSESCFAEIWIHTHYESGVPVQIDPASWYGRVDLLEYVTDENNINDIEILIPNETWVECEIEYDTDEGRFCSVKIIPDTLA